MNVEELRSLPSKVREGVFRKVLTYREWNVIGLLHGISKDDEFRYTPEEVGHIFKVEVSVVRNIESDALRKLANFWIVRHRHLDGRLVWILYEKGKWSRAGRKAIFTETGESIYDSAFVEDVEWDEYEGHVVRETADPVVSLLIDPGAASKEEIAELLYEISKLNRLIGGNGVQFNVVDSRAVAHEEVGS